VAALEVGERVAAAAVARHLGDAVLKDLAGGLPVSGVLAAAIG